MKKISRKVAVTSQKRAVTKDQATTKIILRYFNKKIQEIEQKKSIAP